jgi:hypothetical protein
MIRTFPSASPPPPPPPPSPPLPRQAPIQFCSFICLWNYKGKPARNSHISTRTYIKRRQRGAFGRIVRRRRRALQKRQKRKCKKIQKSNKGSPIAYWRACVMRNLCEVRAWRFFGRRKASFFRSSRRGNNPPQSNAKLDEAVSKYTTDKYSINTNNTPYQFQPCWVGLLTAKKKKEAKSEKQFSSTRVLTLSHAHTLSLHHPHPFRRMDVGFFLRAFVVDTRVTTRCRTGRNQQDGRCIIQGNVCIYV